MKKIKICFKYIKHAIFSTCLFLKKQNKKIWWIILVSLGVYYCAANYKCIINSPNFFNVTIVLITVVLLLLPLLTEIEIYGIKIKKDIEKLSDDVKSFKYEVKNELINLKINNNFSASINFNARDIEQAQQDVSNIILDADEVKDININSDNIDLFKIRYDLEQRIRKILQQFDANFDIHRSYYKTEALVRLEIINWEEQKVLTNLNRLCNMAVHGQTLKEEDVIVAKKSYKLIDEKLKQRGF